MLVAAAIVPALVAAAPDVPVRAHRSAAAPAPHILPHGPSTVRHLLHPRVPEPDSADIIERRAHRAPDGPLLLFLPATRAVPQDYTAFLHMAAGIGYHVLGLTYWNTGHSVARTCGANPRCYTQVQTNRLDGTHPSVFSRVPARGGILHRFDAAIAAAQRSDPAGGWRRYLSDGRPVWSRIVVAGHSQGGGEAAFIAHLHRVQGVLMFSSPVDDDQGVLPTWMHGAGATPADRMWAFDDTGDFYHDRIVGSWRALGIPSAIDFGRPHSDAHLLESGIRLGTPGQAHDRSVTDATPGVRTGRPIFAAQWTWMLRHAYDAPDVRSAQTCRTGSA